MARAGAHDTQLATLFDFGLGYPGAHVKSPWPGHRDLAVKDKTFAYLSPPGEPLAISCKLPSSCGEALRLPFTSPTEYGLGKSGWVSARFAPGDDIPVDMLKAWIDESYRAQAPKRLSASVPPLGEGGELEARLETLARGGKKTTSRSAQRSTAARARPKSPGSKKAKRNPSSNARAAKRPRRKATAAKRG